MHRHFRQLLPPMSVVICLLAAPVVARAAAETPDKPKTGTSWRTMLALANPSEPGAEATTGGQGRPAGIDRPASNTASGAPLRLKLLIHRIAVGQ